MIVLKTRNVHSALPIALHMLWRDGVPRDSRNGPLRQMAEPVSTVYLEPRERVLFHEWRDGNPFFHFYESLWMLAGRRDIAPLTRYAKQLFEYSDDGLTQNAAYGHRWRQAHPCQTPDGIRSSDQLWLIATALRKNPLSRQEVLQIWDPWLDLGTRTKDHACNLTATFQVGVSGNLDMVVLCRSNDAVWGCYGANAVHFSVLLEYMSLRVGVPVGTYTQVSVNLHAYDKTAEALYQYGTRDEDSVANPYEIEPVYPYPLASYTPDMMDQWDEECRRFVTADGRAPEMMKSTDDRFWWEVAYPIVRAHDAYKDLPDDVRYTQALAALSECEASDWRLACEQWIRRRHKNHMETR